MGKLSTLVALAVLLVGCAENLPTKPTGAGVPFDQAANQAVQEQVGGFMWWTWNGKAVAFQYDDNGRIRSGEVTVYATPTAYGWYVAPWQCDQAPAGYCDLGTVATAHDLLQLLSAPRGDDCWNWPVVCQLTGFRPAELWEKCGPIGCPVYRCWNPCEVATGTPD